MPVPRLLTVREAATEIGISPAKVWQLISAGRLASVKLDGSRRLRPEAIDKFIESLSDDRPQRRQASA